MGFRLFFLLRRLLIAVSFAFVATLLLLLLLLLLLSSRGCYGCSCSSTLLLLVLPVSFPFIVSKIKQLAVFSSKLDLNLSSEEEITKEESDELQPDEVVANGGECLSTDNDSCSVSDENLDKLDRSVLINASSDDSISDDESLIEIALGDEPRPRDLKGGFLPDFLPDFSTEMLFRKDGLIELLSEINEEDNMIEIDIVMGSIKCSRFEIEA